MGKTHAWRCERGYAMAALLVAMTVMAIVLSTAMPVYSTVARREREAELVFRGEQYRSVWSEVEASMRRFESSEGFEASGECLVGAATK